MLSPTTKAGRADVQAFGRGQEQVGGPAWPARPGPGSDTTDMVWELEQGQPTSATFCAELVRWRTAPVVAERPQQFASAGQRTTLPARLR